jgi:hypothetical protein
MKLLKENFESDNLYDKLSLLTEVEVKRIVGGLDWVTQNLDAVLIGGTAVVHYLRISNYGFYDGKDAKYVIDKIALVIKGMS